jgi:hypothetical protein
MAELIGVKSPLELLISRSVKREALMFDRVAIPNLDRTLSPNPVHLTEENINFIRELAWLRNEGIIFEPEEASSNQQLLLNDEYVKDRNKVDKLEDELEAIFLIRGREDEAYRERRLYAEYLTTRYTAIQLRELNQTDAYPIFSIASFPEHDALIYKREVARIVLNELPIPDESTSWEQIIEYRGDPDSQAKFFSLRNWMNEVARAKLTPIEVEQKLEYLISQYHRHMELHKMKTNAGALEVIVVSSAEFLEDLVKFKWGKIAKGLFTLKQRRIALMEGELTAPGSEVAYVIKAREHFS